MAAHSKSLVFFLAREYKFPKELEEKAGAAWGTLHDLAHLIIAEKIPFFVDTRASAGQDEAIRQEKIRVTRAFIQKTYNVDIKEKDLMRFEEAVCDLFGVAAASRETGVDFRTLLLAVSDARMLTIEKKFNDLVADRKDPGDFLYYVTPMLDQAYAKFDLAKSGPDNLFNDCLRFAAETYARRPWMFDIPENPVPQELLDPRTQALAQWALLMPVERLAEVPPVPRLMARFTQAHNRLQVTDLAGAPTRAPGRDNGSTPGEHGMS